MATFHKTMQDFAPDVQRELKKAGYFDLSDEQKATLATFIASIGLGIYGRLTKILKQIAEMKNEEVFPIVWRTSMYPGLYRGAYEIAEKYGLRTPLMGSPLDVTHSEQFMRQYYEQHSLEFVKSLTETDIKRMRGYIWMDRNLPEEEFVASLKTKYVFDGDGARFKLIHRVETNRAEQAGQLMYSEQEGMKYKTWHTMQDSRVREEHAAQDDMQIGIDEVFPNGERFPGEQSIGCRCWLTYESEKNE